MPTMKDQILARSRSAILSSLVPIEVPEWGVTAYVKSLTHGEADAYGWAAHHAVRGNADFFVLKARMISACLCDGDGERLFSLEEAGRLAPEPVVERVFQRIKEVVERKVDAASAEGNSAPTPPSGSSSDSP